MIGIFLLMAGIGLLGIFVCALDALEQMAIRRWQRGESARSHRPARLQSPAERQVFDWRQEGVL